MDTEGFDRIAKAASKGTDRRRLPADLLGGAIPGLLGARPVAADGNSLDGNMCNKDAQCASGHCCRATLAAIEARPLPVSWTVNMARAGGPLMSCTVQVGGVQSPTQRSWYVPCFATLVRSQYPDWHCLSLLHFLSLGFHASSARAGERPRIPASAMPPCAASASHREPRVQDFGECFKPGDVHRGPSLSLVVPRLVS